MGSTNFPSASAALAIVRSWSEGERDLILDEADGVLTPAEDRGAAPHHRQSPAQARLVISSRHKLERSGDRGPITVCCRRGAWCRPAEPRQPRRRTSRRCDGRRTSSSGQQGAGKARAAPFCGSLTDRARRRRHGPDGGGLSFDVRARARSWDRGRWESRAREDEPGEALMGLRGPPRLGHGQSWTA